MAFIAEFTVYGRPVRKSNNRIAVMSRGVPRIIKSKSAREFYSSFVVQVPSKFKVGYEGAVHLHANVFHSPMRGLVRANIKTADEAATHGWMGDLSVEAIMDCLQLSGVIKDDRQIISISAIKSVSFDNPRVEVHLRSADADALMCLEL